jgi:hypothetical protein
MVRRHNNRHLKEVLTVREVAALGRPELNERVVFALQLVLMLRHESHVAYVIENDCVVLTALESTHGRREDGAAADFELERIAEQRFCELGHHWHWVETQILNEERAWELAHPNELYKETFKQFKARVLKWCKRLAPHLIRKTAGDMKRRCNELATNGGNWVSGD